MVIDVRERARDALRAEIAEAVYDLLAERGFDNVTVEQAAQHAGISRATFFRYFGSKEDVVLAAVQTSRFDLAAALDRVPPVPGEPVWHLLHRALEAATEDSGPGASRSRARIRMIVTNPSLRARLMESQLAREDGVTAALARHLADPDDARTLAVATLAVMDLAWREWAFGDDPSLHSVLKRLFVALDAGASPVRPVDGREG